MNGATSALYEALIERDGEAIARHARAFASTEGLDELWRSVTRFAVLAWAPSQHSRRALMACRAAYDLRDLPGERFLPFIIECARYAAASRRPWSEPPIVETPETTGAPARDRDLSDAIEAGDRPAAERWLAARLQSGESLAMLRAVLTGNALLTADTVLSLAPLLGSKGAWAVYRLAIADAFEADREPPIDHALASLLEEVVAEHGSIESVRRVFLYDAAHEQHSVHELPAFPLLEEYELARDFAQTLIAHAVVSRLPMIPQIEPFLEAVHRNLREGESFAAWSQA